MTIDHCDEAVNPLISLTELLCSTIHMFEFTQGQNVRMREQWGAFRGDLPVPGDCEHPTANPTFSPLTDNPTSRPSPSPTRLPTASPSTKVTPIPTAAPTPTPTLSPAPTPRGFLVVFFEGIWSVIRTTIHYLSFGLLFPLSDAA